MPDDVEQDIFISYPHSLDDRGHVTWFRNELRKTLNTKLGWKPAVFLDKGVFPDKGHSLDESSLPEGRPWPNQLRRALGEAVVFIPMICPAFYNSAYCVREIIEFARIHSEDLQNGQRAIYPVMTEEVDISKIRIHEQNLANFAESVEFIQGSNWRSIWPYLPSQGAILEHMGARRDECIDHLEQIAMMCREYIGHHADHKGISLTESNSILRANQRLAISVYELARLSQASSLSPTEIDSYLTSESGNTEMTELVAFCKSAESS